MTWSGLPSQHYLTRIKPNSPTGAECPGGDLQPIPQEGYWSSYGPFADKVYECTRGTCSGAADDAACWTATTYSTCDASTIQCSEGATGILCGACQPEFTFNKIQNACVACTR